MGAHLLIDGMNLIGSRAGGWWRDPDGAIRRLIEELEAHAASTGDALEVVFDYRPGGLRPGTAGGIKVRFADGGRDAADRLIAALVREHPHPETVTVVTSDKALREAVERAGASVIGAGTFARRLGDEG